MKKFFLLTFIIIGLCCSSNNEENIESNIDDNGECRTPSAFVVENITSNSATLTWADNNVIHVQLFNIEYGERGFTLGNGTRVSSGESSKSITNLSSGIEYDFYVRANCGGSNYSNWAGPHSFITN